MQLQNMLQAARPFVSNIVGRAGSLLGPASMLANGPPYNSVMKSPSLRIGAEFPDANMPNVDYSAFGMSSPMDKLRAAMANKQPAPTPAPQQASGMEWAGPPGSGMEWAGPPAQTTDMSSRNVTPPMPQPRPASAPQAMPMQVPNFQDQWNTGVGRYDAYDAPGTKSNVLDTFLKLFGK